MFVLSLFLLVSCIDVHLTLLMNIYLLTYHHRSVSDLSYNMCALHYIKDFQGGLSKKIQGPPGATRPCADKIAETSASSVFVETPVETAQM